MKIPRLLYAAVKALYWLAFLTALIVGITGLLFVPISDIYITDGVISPDFNNLVLVLTSLVAAIYMALHEKLTGFYLVIFKIVIILLLIASTSDILYSSRGESAFEFNGGTVGVDSWSWYYLPLSILLIISYFILKKQKIGFSFVYITKLRQFKFSKINFSLKAILTYLFAVVLLVAGYFFFLYQHPVSHNAVVKIKTYATDQYGRLEFIASGSGVVINPSGVVITNRHVAEKLDTRTGKPREIGFVICFSDANGGEFVCSHSANLILMHEQEDLALLKINTEASVFYLSRDKFDYLKISNGKKLKIGDDLKAIGFPLNMTRQVTAKGVVSSMSDYDNSGILSDVIIGPGSSGGAVVNSSNELIGITTSAYVKDKYAGIVASKVFFDWVDKHKLDPTAPLSFVGGLRKLVYANFRLDYASTYISYDLPLFSVTKDKSWSFFDISESNMTISENADGASMGVVLFKHKNIKGADLGDLLNQFKIKLMTAQEGFFPDVVSTSTIKLGSTTAMLVNLFDVSASERLLCLVPAGDDYIEMYSYNNDSSNLVPEFLTIIKSLRLIEIATTTASKKILSLENPKLKLPIINGWEMVEYENGDNIALLQSQNSRAGYINISYEESLEGGANNLEELNTMKRKIEQSKRSTSMLNETVAILVASNVSAVVNKQIKDVIRTETTINQIRTNEILDQVLKYKIRVGNKYLVIRADYFSADKNGFELFKKEVEKILKGLVIGG